MQREREVTKDSCEGFMKSINEKFLRNMLIHVVEFSDSHEKMLLKINLFSIAAERYRKAGINPEELATGLLRNDDVYNVQMIYYFFDVCLLSCGRIMKILFFYLSSFLTRYDVDYKELLENLDEYTVSCKSHYFYYPYSEKENENFEDARFMSGLVADVAGKIQDNVLLAQVVNDSAEYFSQRLS